MGTTLPGGDILKDQRIIIGASTSQSLTNHFYTEVFLSIG
jgi:hypothetical protein